MTEVVASVDLGSHSLHLQLAEVTGGRLVFGEVYRDGTSLAANGALGGRPLDPLDRERALAALLRFRELADAAGARHRVAWATAALREACDARAFLDEASVVLGCPVRVLDGHEEALVTWLGSRLRVPPDPPPLVVDLGAGSTEICFGHDDPALLASFPIGHARAADRWPRARPCDALALVRDVASEVEELVSTASTQPWQRLVATGGTVRTLAKMATSGRADGVVLDQATLHDLVELLARTPCDAVGDLPGADPRRQHTLLHGAALWCALLEALGRDELTVVRPTLREGLLELWRREQGER